MRSARFVAFALVALVATACTGSASPNWTYAPAASVSPAASAAGSAGASGSPAASGGASASPAATGSAKASGGGGGGNTTVSIVASGVQFTTNNVSAPAGQKLTLSFDNQDASVQHNVDIKDQGGTEVLKTDLLAGPAKKDYDLGPLDAGTYSFVCDVHPNMTGTLTVK
jgi:plastocyanin